MQVLDLFFSHLSETDCMTFIQYNSVGRQASYCILTVYLHSTSDMYCSHVPQQAMSFQVSFQLSTTGTDFLLEFPLLG